jgi:hypothetical protein
MTGLEQQWVSANVRKCESAFAFHSRTLALSHFRTLAREPAGR